MNARARGFTLLESLIALLLLSLGLFGAWALQLTGLAAHADAQRQAAAMNLLRDMADRIRANPAAGELYDSSQEARAAPCDAASPCDVATRAAADLAQFLDAAHTLFPGTDTFAAIEYAPATGSAATDHYALTLRWRGTRDSETVRLQLLAPPVAG